MEQEQSAARAEASRLGLEVVPAERPGVPGDRFGAPAWYVLRLPGRAAVRWTLDRVAAESQVPLAHGFVLRADAAAPPPPLAREAAFVAHELRDEDVRFVGESDAIRVLWREVDGAEGARRIHRLLRGLAEAVLKSAVPAAGGPAGNRLSNREHR